jgi:hypothetical protein
MCVSLPTILALALFSTHARSRIKARPNSQAHISYDGMPSALYPESSRRANRNRTLMLRDREMR